MTAIPARVAGVPEVVVCSPPGPDGAVDDAVLAAAALAGIDEMYRIGGAQAVAALAYGTASIAPVDIDALKRHVVIAAAIGVGAAVALCGVIGFVGLVVPHLVRLIAGPDHRIVLPGSIALGAALLVLADVVARTGVAPAELPLGVVTALVGGPFFLWLLRRQPAAWR